MIGLATILSLFVALVLALAFTPAPLAQAQGDDPTDSWSKHYIDSELDGPVKVCVCDIDAEGKPDVVVASNRGVVWYQAPDNPTGIWTKYNIAALKLCRGIDVHDIDADGNPDVVATGYLVNYVVWYKAPADPTGTWTRCNIDTNLGYACGVYVSDIDSDGNPDVVAAGSLYNDVVWYKAPADPTTGTWTKVEIDTNLVNAVGIDICDIDGDGNPDVVAAGSLADDVVWYKAPADPVTGTWAKYYIDTELEGANCVYVHDIDADGNPDVVATGFYDDAVVWYEAPDNPTDTWSKHEIDASLDGAYWVSVWDIDADGSPDVVATGFNADDVVWYELPLAGCTWGKHNVDTNFNGAGGVDVYDIDGDVNIDVVVAGIDAVVWYEAPDDPITGTWTKHNIDTTLSHTVGVYVDDIDEDSNPDVVAIGSSTYTTDAVVWFEAPDDPTGTWTRHDIDIRSVEGGGVYVYDIDSDNDPDVVASWRYIVGGDVVVWYEAPADPTGTWTKHNISTTWLGNREVYVYDMDSDGNPDVVAAGYSFVVWYEAPDDPTGTWTTYHTIDYHLDGVRGIYVYDIDSDGNPDVVATGFNDDAVVWYEAPDNPIYTWTKHYIDTNLGGATQVYVSDIDSDGNPDVVATGSEANDVVWYEGPADPTGNWTRRDIDINLDGAYGVYVYDFSADGNPDVVATGSNADDVVWYEAEARGKDYKVVFWEGTHIKRQTEIVTAQDGTVKSQYTFVDARDGPGTWYAAVYYADHFSSSYDAGDPNLIWTDSFTVENSAIRSPPIAIYYVSRTGDDSTGNGSEGAPWRTITKAVAMASDGDIIRVMDDDNEDTLDYRDNVDVDKELTIERYNDAGPNPEIGALSTTDHVFHVSASNVTIRGLDIGGASGLYMSGIYLDGADHCTIQNNRCYGNGCGIRLSNSSVNTISDNRCERNFDIGIYLSGSSNNTLTNNRANENTSGEFPRPVSRPPTGYGIMLSGSNYNTLIGNTANDNKGQASDLDPRFARAYGIYISNSDFNTVVGNTANSNRADGWDVPGYAYGIIVEGSTGNTISGNTANDNHGYTTPGPGGIGWGIYVAYSTDNTISDNTANSNFGEGLIGWDIYLLGSTNNIIINNTIYDIGLYDSSNDNDIYLNNFGAIDSDSTNDWSSPTLLCYKYASTPHRSYMGNYYYYHAGADTDNDGICDDPYYYTTDNGDDQNPLWQTSDSYSLFAWWLGNPWTMYKGDMKKGPGTVTIPAGGSVTWIADEVALTNVAFPASQGWTGQLVFTSAPEIGDDFTVEIGSSDGGFAPGGPQATLTGDGSATTFTYTTNNASFTVQGGHYLALRITIGSAASYDVRTGGAWSYTSAPDLSCPLYPPIPPGRDIRTPIDIDFGDVPVGSSRDETTTIYNDGDGTTSLTVNNITRISGSDEFTYVGPETPFGISGGAGRIVTIRFAPTSTGAKSATFNINSNDPDEPDVTFDVSGNGESTVEIQLSLQAGWNMVSLPVMPADNSTSAVFPEVAGVFTWNATSRSYYVPTVIDPEKGYWVAVTENTTIAINGTSIETWTTDIKAGWNMIGSVITITSIAAPNDDPDGSVITPAYWWDPVSKSYALTTDIEPGKGYWVASINDCTLTL